MSSGLIDHGRIAIGNPGNWVDDIPALMYADIERTEGCRGQYIDGAIYTRRHTESFMRAQNLQTGAVYMLKVISNN